MEQKRFLLFMAASMGVFVVWILLFPPKKPVAKPPQPAPTAEQPKETGPEKKPETPAPEIKPPEPEAIQEAEPKTVTLEKAGRFKAVLDNRGAVLKTLETQFAEEEETVPMLAGFDKRAESFLIEGLEHAWEVTEETPTAVTFATSKGALRFEKRFFFDPDNGHLFKVDLKIENVGSSEPVDRPVRMVVFNGIERDSEYRYESYLSGLFGTQRESDDVEFTYQTLQALEKAPVTLPAKGKKLLGLKNRHFALLAIFAEANVQDLGKIEFQALSDEELAEVEGRRNVQAFLTLDPSTRFLPKAPRNVSLEIYAGPIRRAELDATGKQIAGLFDPTGFNWIGSLLLWIMNLFSGLGYGIAIMITTIIIRACLLPMSIKSQINMQKMQKIQPLMSAIQEKYKGDRERLGMEQMKLFKEHKVNPLMGCLPLLIQLPVFLGMYSILDISVDLRGSSFLWADDMTEPDRLVDFGRTIKLIDIWFIHFWVDGFNLFPIIMVIAWIAQSMTMPMPEDPQRAAQQKMFKFMPLLFGFICYNLAAGLSWYFFVNSMLGFAEQKFIRKRFEKQFGTLGKPS